MVAFLAIGLACAWPGRAEVGIFGDGSTIDLATIRQLSGPEAYLDSCPRLSWSGSLAVGRYAGVGIGSIAFRPGK